MVLIRFALVALSLASILIAGCASTTSRKEELGQVNSTPPSESTAASYAPIPPPISWAGRLAYKVEDQPSQSYSGAFELRGAPQAGSLNVLSPFGTNVAQLSWQPGLASLRESGQTREFESLQALLKATTGMPLPVAALFDWLAGIPSEVDGWEVDLRLHEQGRYTAKRTGLGQAAVELRIILDR